MNIQQLIQHIGGLLQNLQPVKDVSNAVNVGSHFVNQMQQNPINWNNYQAQVNANQQHPFFNNQGNNPIQWLGKVAQDVQQRGPFEGLQDLSYPVLMNPRIEPIEEPIVSNMRVANYQAGRPFPLLNSLLGQTNQQMAQPRLSQPMGQPAMPNFQSGN